MANSTIDEALCLMALKRFEMGQYFNVWVIHLYNEMMEKEYHQ